MAHTAPGTPELRSLIAPFVSSGAYPKARLLSENDVNRMSPCMKRNFVKLRGLLEQEARIAASVEDLPKDGSSWALLRIEIRDLVSRMLVSAPELIAIEILQEQAIEKGAIPDPDAEESGMKYFRLPNWNFACWTCGMPVKVATISHSVHVRGFRGAGTGEVRNQTVLYCPRCETKPSQYGTPVYV